MIHKKITDAFNGQINAETYSAYLYWSMAAWFESINLAGFANWMKVQAQEEMTHAIKFYDYILARGGKVVLKQIETPPAEWKSPLDVFEASYKHEQKVTGLINNLANLATKENDHAAQVFLQWFITEQIEEEKNAFEIIQKLKLADGAAGAMFMLDKDLAARVFTPPAAAQP
jgi:ferritin